MLMHSTNPFIDTKIKNYKEIIEIFVQFELNIKYN